MRSKNRRKSRVYFGNWRHSAFLARRVCEQTGDGVNAQTRGCLRQPPAPPAFDQAAALAKLREQIKGRETEPAEKVFKNMQMLKQMPAGRLLAVMEMGYARSLGVNCTHCHVPDKWESEDKPQKQIAREMWAMMGKINSQLLKSIKNLRSENADRQLHHLSSRAGKTGA